jgi:hypothetical protein
MKIMQIFNMEIMQNLQIGPCIHIRNYVAIYYFFLILLIWIELVIDLFWWFEVLCYDPILTERVLVIPLGHMPVQN